MGRPPEHALQLPAIVFWHQKGQSGGYQDLLLEVCHIVDLFGVDNLLEAYYIATHL